MKSLLSITIFLLSIMVYGQDTEFGKTQNGLIYSDATINQLKHIVDSLNLKFKVCDLHKTYYTKLQAKANYIFLDSVKVKEAKEDIDANISYEAFISKYPYAETDTHKLVVKYDYISYSNEEGIEFRSVEPSKRYSHTIDIRKNLDDYKKSMLGKWVYSYYEGSEYGHPSISAFYFIEDFKSKTLSEKYARLVQYADCMIDTNSSIFYDTKKKKDTNSRTAISTWDKYMSSATKKPNYPKDGKEKSYENFYAKFRAWDTAQFIIADSLFNMDKKFKELLNDATEEALKSGGSYELLEEYIGRYISRSTELELKRRRRVIGNCSMDNSPRVHAQKIAELSAYTLNWNIFLRAHLDIMNDRFDRVSDGSYAWEARKTYIKELELLDINVIDLILGISLRIENPGNNHYFGSINRLGRALSEAKNKQEVESKMLQMISDNELDDYNRMLLFFLFLNYNNYLEDKVHQNKNSENLKEAVKSMPVYLHAKMEFK